MTGKIKTLTDKGYGFISMGPGKKDLFFHARNLVGISYNELQVGDELRFDIEDGDKGPSAVNVELAEQI